MVLFERVIVCLCTSLKMSAAAGKNESWKKQERSSAEGKWLRMFNAVYKDPRNGVERTYECVERTRARSPDGVDIIPILRHSSGADGDKEVILLKQYRPPVNATVLEFPAGLVEEGEDPLEAGLRELKEETGFVAERKTAHVWSGSPVLHADPSITSDSTVVYVVDVDADREENLPKNRKQALEDSENIVVQIVPLSSLYDTCVKAAEDGCVIDVKVYMFAMGLHLASSLT